MWDDWIAIDQAQARADLEDAERAAKRRPGRAIPAEVAQDTAAAEPAAPEPSEAVVAQATEAFDLNEIRRILGRVVRRVQEDDE